MLFDESLFKKITALEPLAQECLRKILSSRNFKKTQATQKFLIFLVQLELEGRGGKLSQDEIHAEHYEGNGWPSSVAQQMSQLRLRLGQYYQEEGKNEPIIFSTAARGFWVKWGHTPHVWDVPQDAKIFFPWSDDRLKKLLDNAKENEKIKIYTIVFLDWSKMLHSLRELVNRGVHIELVMMNPENRRLIEARFKLRRDLPPKKAHSEIVTQLNDCELIRAELKKKRLALKKKGDKDKISGTLEVRRSDLMPLGFYLELENKGKILLGLMPPLMSYLQGPMIEVNAKSQLGQILQESWQTYWDNGLANKL